MTYRGKLPVEQWLVEIGWFGDKICVCPNDGGVYQNGYDWEHMSQYKEPPSCKWCGKWQNRIHKCCRCDQYFYEFFNHSRSGYHDKPRRGWYCWNCLERAYPPIVQPVKAKMPKVAPPASVLPPGYVLDVED